MIKQKYLLLGLLILLLIVIKPIAMISPVSATTSTESLRQAQILIQQGQLELNQGKAQTALETWQQATEIYIELEDEEGIKGGLINQSIALQSLGKNYLACRLLVKTLELEPLCDLNFQAEEPLPEYSLSLLNEIALRSLGNVLRAFGRLDLSQQALVKSREMAKELDNPHEIGQTLLALGNTERRLYQRQRELYERTGSSLPNNLNLAIREGKKALVTYEEVITKSLDETISIQGEVNRLSLFLDLKNWEEINKTLNRKDSNPVLYPDLNLETQNLLEKLAKLSPINQNSINLTARLNFVHHLLQYPPQSFDNWLGVEELLQDTLQQASSLKNGRLQSYTWGYLGILSIQQGELAQALPQLTAANKIATAIDAPEIGFRWEAELGKLYRLKQQQDLEIAAYEKASTDLDEVRKRLGTINPELLSSFFQEIKPIYLSLIELYLKDESEINLKKVLDVYEKLQLAELQNFIQCDLEETTTIEDILLTSERPPTVIYTIFLEDKVEVIVNAPQKELYAYPVDSSKLKDQVKQLRVSLKDLASPNTDVWGYDPKTLILPYSQEIYRLLIAPAKNAGYLTENETLVFSLDSSLQNIPMAILHDGENYLVENYNIAIALGVKVKTPTSLSNQTNKITQANFSAIVGGLSISSPSLEQFNDIFEPLPDVRVELDYLKEIGITDQELLDEGFTTEKLRKAINESILPIIHLATHGKFSSDPDQTFLVAYDNLISVQQLGNLIRSKAIASTSPIELLVLSACQTAASDERSALGMAGVALQAGARSTLATLWSISDEATPELIRNFYEGLQAGKTKAEALGDAQRKMLNNPKYKHPYYWAAFVLAGNWL